MDRTAHSMTVLAYRGIKDGLPPGSVVRTLLDDGGLILELTDGRRIGVAVVELERGQRLIYHPALDTRKWTKAGSKDLPVFEDNDKEVE